MKKRFLFPLFGLFLTLMAGCSDDLNEQTNNGGPASDAKNYLSINIVTATKTGTRADAEDNQYPMPDNSGHLYQDGTTEENYVQSVSLFFFDSSGNAAPINDKNESSIYRDIQPSDNNGGEDHSSTVEKILKTTFEITSSTGNLPTQVLAILNPTPYIKSLTRPSLTTLRNIVRDFKTSTDEENKIDLTNNNFVMSNSVYAENGKTVYATALSNEDYYTSADEADKHPVSIFVERVLARLDLIISPDLTNTAVETLTLYKATREGDDIEGEETAVYAKLLDWNITTTPKKSRLIKEINPAWPDQFFGQYEPWNAANYHRSFWAINPEGLTYPGDYLFSKYPEDALFGNSGQDAEETTGTRAVATGNNDGNFTFATPGTRATVYLQENAAPYDNDTEATEHPTKVILTAQLTDKDGNPLEIAQYGNQRYTVEGVKIVLAELLKDLYKKTSTTDSDGKTTITYEGIETKDLIFKSESDPDKLGGYAQTVTVKMPEGTEWEWVEKVADKQYQEFEDDDALNNYVKEKTNGSQVIVWRDGRTYYHFDLRHLVQDGDPKFADVTDKASLPGYYGIVRNHIYEAKVTKIKGLGTPPNYTPGKDEEIIPPDAPTPTSGTLSVEVRILSWRIVSQEYEITW